MPYSKTVNSAAGIAFAHILAKGAGKLPLPDPVSLRFFSREEIGFEVRRDEYRALICPRFSAELFVEKGIAGRGLCHYNPFLTARFLVEVHIHEIGEFVLVADLPELFTKVPVEAKEDAKKLRHNAANVVRRLYLEHFKIAPLTFYQRESEYRQAQRAAHRWWEQNKIGRSGMAAWDEQPPIAGFSRRMFAG